MPVEEGDRYKLAGIHFTGNKAVTNVRALRGTFAIKDGEYFNATVMSKGLENLKKAYGQLGYINFAALPSASFDEAKKKLSVGKGNVIRQAEMLKELGVKPSKAISAQWAEPAMDEPLPALTIETTEELS